MTAALHSIWLAPAAPEAEALSAAIHAIATQTRTAPFAPHMTLLGDLAAPLARIEDTAARLAALGPPVATRVTGLDGEATRFRALFLALAPVAGLSRLRRACEAALPPDAGCPPLRPHLSLGYGPRAHARLGALQARLAPWLGRGLVLDRVQIVRSAATIPIADWQVVASLQLRPRPPGAPR